MDAAVNVFEVDQLIFDVVSQYRHRALRSPAVDMSVNGGEDLGDEIGIVIHL